MNTTYGQDIWNYGAGTLRNCGEGFGGLKAVVALKKGFTHFLRFAAMLILMVVGVSGAWGQTPPFTLTTADDITNGTQKYYLIQSIDRPSFYAIPRSNSDGAKVFTTSIPNADMRWCFVDAGSDSDHQYYYIVNSTGRCLYRYNDSDDGIQIKNSYANLSGLADDELNKYKFYLTQTGSDYFIQPKGASGLYLNKRGSNVRYQNAYYIKASTYHDSPSVWNFVAVGSVTWTQPFTVSTNSEKHYYKFPNVTNTSFCLSNSEEWATVSSAGGDEDIWYFLDAGADATYSNFHYYYIVNASTEKYLYHTGGTGNDVAKVMDYNSAEADKFRFLIVDAAYKPDNTNYSTGYTIVPKLRQTYFYDKDSYAPMAMNDGSHLLLKIDRATSGSVFNYDSHWTIESVWADPEISCDADGHITIENGEEGDGAEFYYTMNNSTTPPATPTATESATNFKYNSASKPIVGTGLTTIKVRAIAAGKSDSRVITQKIVYIPNQTFDSSIYDGTAQVPEVIVGETTISSDEYNISYKQGGTDVTECKNAGEYTVTITDKDGGEYIVYGSGSFTINPASVTLTANSGTETYDGTEKTVTGFTCKVGEQTVDGLTFTGVSASVSGTNAGTYDVTFSGVTVNTTRDDTNNYVVTETTNGVLTINPASVTLIANSGTETYDGTEKTVTGFTCKVGEQTVDGLTFTGVSASVSGTNAGTYDVTFSGVTVNTTKDTSGNYLVTETVDGALTINPASVTLTGSSGTETYDGTEKTVTGFTCSVDGLTFTGVSASGSGTNAGTYDVTFSGVTVNTTRDDTNNYVVTETTNGTLTIGQKEVGLTWSSTTLTYNGTAQAPAATATGLVNGDEVSVTVTGTETNAGTGYTATASGLTGTNSGNYKLPSTNTTTFSIAAKAVTIKADDASKTYNSTALTESGFDASALETGDDHTFTVVMTDESTITNVGTQPNVIATVDGITVTAGTETAVGNYLVTTANGELEITAKEVTITASDASKTYNSTALTESGFDASALEEGDEHTFTVVMTEGSTITNVGTQSNVIATVDGTAVTTGNATAVGNYLVTTANGELEITAKEVTITANNASKSYDGSALTEAGFTASALEPGDTHTFTVVMSDESTITNSGTQPNVIATVDGVSVTTGAETAVGNYLVTTVNGTLTVTGKFITITADSDTKVYDGTALTKDSYAFDNTELDEGDAITRVTVTGSQTVVGSSDNVPSAAVIMNGETDVTGKYSITYVNGTLEVTRKAVTITASDASETYNGSALTEAGFTASALETGDDHTFTVVMTDESTITNAGTQPNVIATVDGVSVTTGVETEVGNYLVTTADGTLEVTRKAVTITANDASKPYDGSALTEGGFTATALETGDEHTFTVVMTEESTITNAGTQPNVIATVDGVSVTTGVETEVGNYLVTTVEGTLTVDGKSIGDGTIPADGISINITRNADNTFTVNVYDGTTLLDVGTEGTQYDYSITTTGSAATKYYEVTITGANNYSGEAIAKYANVTFSKKGSNPWGATFVTNSTGDDDFATPSGMTAYIVTGISGNIVELQELEYIPENVPVLLLSENEVDGFLVTPKGSGVTDITEEQKSGNLLKTEDSNTEVSVATIYLYYEGEFVLNKAGTLPAGRVYLSKPSGVSGVRLQIFSNNMTGIDTSHLSTSMEIWYTLDGRRLNGRPTKKGLYIRNGQKVVIK